MFTCMHPVSWEQSIVCSKKACLCQGVFKTLLFFWLRLPDNYKVVLLWGKFDEEASLIPIEKMKNVFCSLVLVVWIKHCGWINKNGKNKREDWSFQLKKKKFFGSLKISNDKMKTHPLTKCVRVRPTGHVGHRRACKIKVSLQKQVDTQVLSEQGRQHRS